MADVEARLRKIVCDQLGVDEEEVTANASFRDDLGADSLDAIELTMATEEEFGLEIDDDEAAKLTTFGVTVVYDTDTSDEPGTRWQGDPVRVRLRNPKGGDQDEWPEHLRVREFPS